MTDAADATGRGAPVRKAPTSSLASRTGCPSCGYQNRVGARFCGDCATALTSVPCPACQAAVPAGQKFCDACGRPVGDLLDTAPHRVTNCVICFNDSGPDIICGSAV